MQILCALKLVRQLGHLRLGRLGLLLLALLHQAADLLGEHLALVAQGVGLLHGVAVLAVQVDDLVHQIQLVILELLLHILAHDVRRLAEHVDIQHVQIFLSKSAFTEKFSALSDYSPNACFLQPVFPFPS